ncbi:NAD-glutamate dehydrogenase domain-containing protein [Geopsychrobacter electrodiphilus]|uniref:NAD-glutamate dehydrogenase domain-containing protein n=1 Tax=Geopsychrobacter electrodiphilus TaxID=225196 RepID=UPI00038038E9|nr:NAD-glutamate dehydrogenase domain-containing protein [Geopsychrobacter electrodiphilus]
MDCDMLYAVQERISLNTVRCGSNLEWLKAQMHPYFFITNSDQLAALANLASGLHNLEENRRLTLLDKQGLLMLAQVAGPGSLYKALRSCPEQDISYLQINSSYAPIPGTATKLEVLRFASDVKSDQAIAEAPAPTIPAAIMDAVLEAFAQTYADFDASQCARLLQLLWLNNETYVKISPADRVARLLWLYQQTLKHEGVYLAVEAADGLDGAMEYRILFGVGNPPQKGFLPQTLEVFKRLGLKIKRAYGLKLSNGVHPYFLATFYASAATAEPLKPGCELFARLQEELYHTQILPDSSLTYRRLVLPGLTSGADASLIRAFIGFCHTNLAHNHPDSFDLEGVMRAFHNHPELSLQLVKLFRTRFDPASTAEDRDQRYQQVLDETINAIETFTSGRRFLDHYRRTIFRCCLSLIRHTLKTNFFVPEKHALALRIDPAYLQEIGAEFTADLPAERPFRITYFSGRYGSGYHIGFSDIARGGWRTLITQGRDDYVTAANTLFRENYVLAHTQHLKNKDIYEGGSKLVAVLDAGGEDDAERIRQRLYKLQYGFINAFLDIFVTENGVAKDPRVVDYYRDDEPIELGPDENMHDSMIELIALQTVKRNYLLGAGIMSSKRVGINHKEFGVTSLGVVRFAEITLQELGIDPQREPFSVKFTGGPNGDVAGNAMRLLLERAPQVQIKLIVDGTAALFDPEGAEPQALSQIVLKDDLQGFDPTALHPGGFILYRQQNRWDGMRKLYKKLSCTADGLQESWISNDEFYREYDHLIFAVPTDLFIPGGGRPETVDDNNWQDFFGADGKPNTRAIIEGANSFITPAARINLQKGGVVIMRDCSANKCGVISSSYEIIANLLLSDEEFLTHKPRYVADVLCILQQRAEEEARLIFRRQRESQGELLYTEISDAISREINGHYARLFDFFRDNPHLCQEPLYLQTIYRHLPAFVRETEFVRQRVADLPEKIKHAILASEISSSMVYLGGQHCDFQTRIENHMKRLSLPAA